MSTDRSEAPSTKERGDRGEDRAVAELERRGYEILERNFRCRAGEIDIVARDGHTLVFVEVRSRADSDHGDALETVSPAKQRRIAKVAEIYLVMRKPDFVECRFDVVGITGDELTLITDAFRIGV